MEATQYRDGPISVDNEAHPDYSEVTFLPSHSLPLCLPDRTRNTGIEPALVSVLGLVQVWLFLHMVAENMPCIEGTTTSYHTSLLRSRALMEAKL